MSLSTEAVFFIKYFLNLREISWTTYFYLSKNML